MPEKPPRTILLVDDDPLILELGRELLEHLGYRVETASDAAQALEVFQRQGADLVILDYRLPGMDGYQLLQELRALDAGVRVLVATGHALPPGSDPLAGRRGAGDHLQAFSPGGVAAAARGGPGQLTASAALGA